MRFKPSTWLLAVMAASALLYAPLVRAACDTNNLQSPENDCDEDGYTLQQGDCNDDDTPCGTNTSTCDNINGPYPHACVCGHFKGWLEHPGANEVCDGQDDNCNGFVDENLYIDRDSDGVRACGTCMAPAAGSCDCDDTRSNVKPGQAEVCDDLDNNCDGVIDNKAGGGTDSLTESCYGGPSGTQNVGICKAGTETCNASTIGAASWQGCNAVLPANPPAQAETMCNGLDDDCDGVVDDGLSADADGDGSKACGGCNVAAAPNCDCNDNNAAVHPGATEVCNGVDDNCNGQTDEGVSSAACYDGPSGTQNVGLCKAGTAACVGGSTSGTCSNEVTPATEVCDGKDNDCNGKVDDGLYADADGDGYRACGGCNAGAAGSCDCDDNNKNVHPGLTEVCNGVDDNCDGNIDENIAARKCLAGPGITSSNSTNCPGPNCKGKGACVAGTQTCSAGAYGACTGYTGPAPEMCGDCVDSDCDGNLDDGFPDADGDKVPACVDCNDNNKNIHGAYCSIVSAAAEICNGVDDNCNGQIDEGVTAAVDNDGDGYKSCSGCGAPAAGACDCNDNDASIHPNAPEICDCIDQDCDGKAFDGFPDADGDGVPACSSAECDDSQPSVHAAFCTGTPYAVAAVVETCDDRDNDCNGKTDERDAAGDKITQTCYDGPANTAGVGLCKSGTSTCDSSSPGTSHFSSCAGEVLPTAEVCDSKDNDCNGQVDNGFDQDGDGFTTCQGDCNDHDATIHPGATEICDQIDQNCNGSITDVQPRACFFGSTVTPNSYTGVCPGPTCMPVSPCMAGSQFCGTDGAYGDCQNEIVPKPEVCNGVDDDCDGKIDDGNFDADGDGYPSCALCTNYAANKCDCNDSDPTINPGAQEICDGKDNNCDGTVDGVSTSCYTGPAGTLGVGTCRPGTATCTNGQATGTCSGQVLPSNPPSQPETVCNGKDDDCDGVVDDGFDKDGDGAFSCALCPTYGSAICDCDDNNKFDFPGNPEICDCQDNNCNTTVDEGNVCYGAPCFDFDGDGFTNCQGDCNDHNAAINPRATEICGNGVDDDCNGQVDENVDVDKDGWTTCQGDCNDHNASVHPGAVEVCDGFDNDCAGKMETVHSVMMLVTVDEGFDVDGDGVTSCGGDCDDHNANINPFQKERSSNGTCSDGLDNDCDGLVDPIGIDQDGDGVGICQGDCNDHNAAVHGAAGAIPAAPEVCDGNDNNCDDQTDEGFDVDNDHVYVCFNDCNDNDPNVNGNHVEVPHNGIDDNCNGVIDEGQTDVDGDGFTPICGDCNDADPAINPHATEICDRIDNNCDSYVDALPGDYNLCQTCFDADKDGQTNCDGDCNDADPRIYRGAKEVCDGLDNDCDGTIDLDEFGRSVCPKDTDGSTFIPDGGSTDGGVGDGGTSDGGQADGGKTTPPVNVGCGCSSNGHGGGLGTWLVWGAFAFFGLGRLRRNRKAAQWAMVGTAIVALTTGCNSQLAYKLPVPVDAGTGLLPDGGVALISPDWECGTQNPAKVTVTKLPGTRIPFAQAPYYNATVVGANVAFALDDTGAQIAGFALRRPIPTDISPLDQTGAQTVGVRESSTLTTLTGPPLVSSSEARFSRIFNGPSYSASFRITFSAVTEVYTVRNRLLSHFSQKGLSDLTGLPTPFGATLSDTFDVNVMYQIIGDDLVVTGAVTPDALLSKNQSAMLDLTDGSAVAPPGSVLVNACEHRTLPPLLSDFIFVVDNSGSMADKQAELANAGGALYAGFQSSGLDFRLGVVTTDGEVLRGSGFTTDESEFEADVHVGIGGSTTEEGLEFGKRAVQLALTNPDPRRRLRPNAGVVVVFYSDEDDSNLETPDQYAQFFNANGVVTFAIVGPQPSGCVRVGLGSAQSGDSYIQVAAETGGSSGSICDANLGETIQEVLLGALGAASKSPLARQPVSSSLAVRTTNDIVRSRTNGFDFDPSGDVVLFFGSVPATGTAFQVAYSFFVTLQ